MQALNVSSFLSCMHNIDVPEVFFNFVSRTSFKKIGISVGLPGLFDDDFEYIDGKDSNTSRGFLRIGYIALTTL